MKIQKKIELTLLQRPNSRKFIDVVQYDKGVQLVCTVTDFTIPDGTTATLYVQKPSGKFVYQETGISVSGNTVTIDLENQALAEHGGTYYQIQLVNGNDTISTFAGIMRVAKSYADDGAEESKTVIRAFDAKVEECLAEIQKEADKQIERIQDYADNGLDTDGNMRIYPTFESGAILSKNGNESTGKIRIRALGYLLVDDIWIVPDSEHKYALFFYDANKVYCGTDTYITLTTETLNIKATAPANATYFRLVVSRVDDTKIDDIIEETGKCVQILKKMKSYVADALICNEKIARALYTDLKRNNGWWDADGIIKFTEGNCYTQLIPVTAGETYYVGWLNTESCAGAFFDARGNWIAPLNTADIVEHAYQSPDGNKKETDYAQIYKFTAPEGAYYLSYNITTAASYAYRNYIATFPVFALSNTGNYMIRECDPPYQAKKDKSLCVIGASGVMIDRLYRDAISQYVVGFQEYLAPWYKNVGSYGFSSGSWAQYDTSHTSIYTGIVTAGVDLSAYDEFVLIPSTSGLTATGLGEIDSTDITNYLGGLNGVIDYIYSQVPLAKVYLVNAVHKGSYYTDDTKKARMDEVNEKLRQLSEFRSHQLVDLVSGMSINDKTYQTLTYDGTHLNQEGGKLMGLFVRKELIGI